MDNPKNFWVEYLEHIRKISAKTMMITQGEINESELDNPVCGLTTENIKQILSINTKPIDYFNKDIDQEDCNPNHRNVINLIEFLNQHLHSKTVIEVFTVSCDKKEISKGNDHWFALVCGYENESIFLI